MDAVNEDVEMVNDFEIGAKRYLAWVVLAQKCDKVSAVSYTSNCFCIREASVDESRGLSNLRHLPILPSIQSSIGGYSFH